MASKSEWDIVVVGGSYTDYMVHGPHLPKPGETVDGDTFLLRIPGGKGANQAVAAARLGARVTMITKVGSDDRGDEIIDSYKKEGLGIQYVWRDGSEPTGASLIQAEKNGDKQMMVSFGATRKLTVEDIQATAETIRSAKILLTQLEIPVETVLAAIRIAHEAGVQVILDPAPSTKLPDELFPMVNVIKPDTSEAEFLTGIHVQDRNSARNAAKALLQRGVQAASAQAGHEGNLIVWQDGECWLPQIEVKSVDATGAGDTFAAGLAVKLAEGRSMNEAGQFANAAAALSTTKFGARPALPRREEVERLVAKTAR